MNRIKSMTLAIMASLALVFGAAVTAAPAQAVTGSTVIYSHKSSSTPSTVHIRVVRTNGDFMYVGWGEHASNVHHFYAPKGYHLRYSVDGGSTWSNTYHAGEWVTPDAPITYNVRLARN